MTASIMKLLCWNETSTSQESEQVGIMIKNIIQSNEAVTPNAQTLKVLHTHFPQCFDKEGKFDIDKFKDLIKNDIDITQSIVTGKQD